MAITKEDLRDFTHFANQKLENGGVATLSDLVHEWESRRASSCANPSGFGDNSQARDVLS